MMVRFDSSGLPFTVRDTASKSLWRRWRQLSRLQRCLLYMLLLVCALAYILMGTGWSDGAAKDGSFKTQLEPVSNRLDGDAGKVNGAPDVGRIDAVGQEIVDLLQPHRGVNVGRDEADVSPAGDVPRPRVEAPAVVVPPTSDLIPAYSPLPGPVQFSGPTNPRQRAVKEAMQHAWSGYRTHAWGYDHLKPISRRGHNWFGLGLTLIDSLDTMYIMGMHEEFREARDWVASSLNFDINRYVNLFETTIRVLGGLLSAHYFSQDDMFMHKAVDLGNRLLPAFDTRSGIPYSDINLKTGKARSPPWSADSTTAEVATLQLEFNHLSYVSGDPVYSDRVMAVEKHISQQPKKDGLVPSSINPGDGKFRQQSTITMGARGDSYYEYLIKLYVQLGEPAGYLREEFDTAVRGVERHLVKRSHPSGLTFLAELTGAGRSVVPKMDHLACFLPGTLALSVRFGLSKTYMKLAEEMLYTCYQTYMKQPTHLAAEMTYFNMAPGPSEDFYVKPLDTHNLLRPETIESLWYLYHLTGNKTYQDWGWQLFEAFEKYTKVASGGYTSISNVKNPDNVGSKDMMESFFLGETLKYFYLLFADDQKSLNLNDFVFNTEAHPLPVLRRRQTEMARQIAAPPGALL